MDVLFQSAYDQMGLPPDIPINPPFYGFSGHSVHLSERVELLVTADSHPAQATMLTNFLVVDTLNVYNAIIGRLTLNALRVVANTYHLALKFLTPVGVGVV